MGVEHVIVSVLVFLPVIGEVFTLSHFTTLPFV
jgi:hypothetical protein